MTVFVLRLSAPEISAMYCVAFNQIDPSYMVCVRSVVLLCQHYSTPFWSLPFLLTGISREERVFQTIFQTIFPGVGPSKDCVIFFTRLPQRHGHLLLHQITLRCVYICVCVCVCVCARACAICSRGTAATYQHANKNQT